MSDPVLVRRARIASMVSLGKRVGYGLYLVAIVGFAVIIARKPTDLLSAIVITSLIVGSIILIPAIIFGYGVRAAEREDRQR